MQGLLGGRGFSPYAPPPVQFSVDVATLEANGPTTCATWTAQVQGAAQTTEALPDFLGTDSQTATNSLQLIYKTDSPIEFSDRGGQQVESAQDNNTIEVSQSATGKLTASLYFPEGASMIYYALINRSANAPQVTQIKLTNLNQNCIDPNAPTTETTETSPPQTNASDSGCDCQAAGAPIWWLTLIGLGLRRRRH